VVPVWGEEQGALEPDAGGDGVSEGARDALGEEDVFGRELEEDGFEEFGEAEDFDRG